jgi:hypothetical protein
LALSRSYSDVTAMLVNSRATTLSGVQAKAYLTMIDPDNPRPEIAVSACADLAAIIDHDASVRNGRGYRFNKREKDIAASFGMPADCLAALGRLNGGRRPGVPRTTDACARMLREMGCISEAGYITNSGRDVVAKAIRLGW